MSSFGSTRDSAQWSRWQMPHMLAATPAANDREADQVAAVISSEQMEVLRQQAREEGWAQGLEEGRQAARAEQRQLAQRWLALVEQLARPLQDLDAVVEDQLMNLAVELGSQLARRELSVHPEQIVQIVREGLKALPAGSHRIQIHLNPEDARLVTSQLEPDGEHPWRLVESHGIARGGCQITTDGARLDERMETRLERAMQSLLGADAKGHGA